MPKKKTKTVDSMEERLRKFGAKLDDLIEHARQTRDYAKKINLDELLRQKGEIERRIKEMRGPAQDAMKEVSAGLQGAWREIRGATSRAKSKFKK